MNVLLTTNPSRTHLQAMLPIARSLQAASHSVAFACAEVLRPHVAAHGFHSFPAGLNGLEAEAELAFPILDGLSFEQQAWDWNLTEFFADVAARKMVPDLLAISQEWRPQVLVCNDYEFATCVVAELLKLPYATIALESCVPAHIRKHMIGKHVAALRGAYGLSEPAAMASLQLSFFPPGFEGPEFASNPLTHALQPARDDRLGALPTWVRRLPQRPTIYIASGVLSRCGDEALLTLIEALAAESLNLILSVGAGQDLATLSQQPGNLFIAHSIPESLLLPYCDMAITDAGFAATLAVLDHGLPMLVLPATAADAARAARCATLGLGLAIRSPHHAAFTNGPLGVLLGNQRRWLDLSPIAIRDAVYELLHNPRYVERAERCRAEMHALPRIEHAATLIASLVPAPTPTEAVPAPIGPAPRSTTAAPACPLCGNTRRNRAYSVREMMLGRREHFTYIQCGSCEALHLAELPADLGLYYPDTYYSLAEDDQRTASRLPDWLMTYVGGPIISLTDTFGSFTDERNRHLVRRVVDRYLKTATLTPTSRILDVGCGNGSFLHAIAELGYSSLLGIDPFASKEIRASNGVTLLRRSIFELEDTAIWDVIMLNHSFEHMAEPLAVLRQIARLLAPDGICLIRTPVVPCHAWETYGSNWASLDAPRHLFIHSPESIEMLATAAGLRLDSVDYDSTSFQFWASEQYANNISLYDPLSVAVNPAEASISLAQMLQFERKAAELNRQQRGDQAAFYLRRG